MAKCGELVLSRTIGDGIRIRDGHAGLGRFQLSLLRVNVWIGALGITVSSVCTGLFLLVKAYAVRMHDRRLLWLAIPLVLPQAFTVWAAWVESDIMNTLDSGCVVFLPSYYPWVKSIVEIAMNLVYSCIFIKAAFEQYRTFGSRGWRKLGVDNLLYLIFVVISSIIAAFLAMFLNHGMLSEMIYLGEWLVVCCLLIHQHERLQEDFTPRKDRRSIRHFRVLP
ncbi:hypothetical protein BDF22DRAFT_652279 [Syncephalis plumigaleata]|nr:hypothetical protein BDF22DRAFT_652279 [Syncephalis plumigaleata]